MSATLPLEIPPSPSTARRVQPAELRQLEAVAGLTRPGAADEADGEAGIVSTFAAWAGDELAAWGRFGTGAGHDIVVDGMVTLPRHRRRGLARSILAAMDGDARRQGWRRMLLIASPDGRLLYRSVGFEQIAPVSVYGHRSELPRVSD